MLVIGEQYTPQRGNHSSRDPEPSGTLAFYLLMETYTTVERLERSPRHLDAGTLILVEPVRVPTEEEMDYVLQWVGEGNRLLIFGADQALIDYFNLQLTSCPPTFAIIHPHVPHWSSQHVHSLDLSYTQYFSMDEHQGTILFSDEQNPLIIEILEGKGEVFLFSTPSLLSNINIDSKDNEIFLVQLALSQKVYFDEYHLYTIKETKGISVENITMLFSSPYSLFFIQISLAIAFFFIAYGKRFGTPRPAASRHIQSSELVESAATLYLQAGKKDILQILEEDEENHSLPNVRR
jgi:hypothetical protein